ncbi:MAG: ABC transporter ATP-binding protein [Actinobacteria bacterium]|uniref:Macrolide export ATP-binding/permease protein MacB n=1 Tax=hydrothermal vent metagenome TaxID=652676 RepID=A0A3B0SQ78_9ZZZZ|nr:ABC transporter ATP-binding protein [Actinomycetota bacterium]
MTEATVAVRVEDLVKSYGEGETAVQALRGVSFTIPRREFVVILGPSGSGKTTLLNQIGALEPPTSGSLQADGVELGGLDESQRTEYRLRSVGFVFQFFNLVPTLTALENVALIAELTGGDAVDRSMKVLEQVGLGDRVDHFPGQLSGGEQQRVSIARGLVKDPPLLLCDEPTGSLDSDTGVQVLDLLRATTDGGGRSVVVVTHNSTIADMADRVLELRDGHIVRDETNASPSQAKDLDW